MLKSFSSPSNIYKCNFLSSYTCRNLRIRCMMLDYNFSGTLQLLFNCSENAEVFPIFKNTFLYFSSSNAAYLNSYKCNSLYKPIRPQLFRSLFFRFFWGGGGGMVFTGIFFTVPALNINSNFIQFVFRV